MLWLRRPGPESVAAVVADQSARGFSYREVGATAGRLPAGYRHDQWSADLGPFSPEAFDAAAETLRSWGVQEGAGLSVFPGETVRTGATFALVFRLPFGGYVTAAGRIVWVTDDPGRSGFAYGTLPGHPERGEEAFMISRQGDRLVFDIRAFSRPSHWLARAGAPVTRIVQLRVTRRYLTAMRGAVTPQRRSQAP
ncbi:MAG TPA: DUF1990 domain-containing protein [Streptosporangiaceae bacterium]